MSILVTTTKTGTLRANARPRCSGEGRKTVSTGRIFLLASCAQHCRPTVLEMLQNICSIALCYPDRSSPPHGTRILFIAITMVTSYINETHRSAILQLMRQE